MSNFEILKRLYKTYTKKFRYKILLSIFFSLIVAGSTASIAWLLDPAIKKLFIDKDQSLLLIIPGLIVIAFAMKGIFLYASKTTMITVGHELRAIIQSDMTHNLLMHAFRFY